MNSLPAEVDEVIKELVEREITCICGTRYKSWAVRIDDPHSIHDSRSYCYRLALKNLRIVSRWYQGEFR